MGVSKNCYHSRDLERGKNQQIGSQVVFLNTNGSFRKLGRGGVPYSRVLILRILLCSYRVLYIRVPYLQKTPICPKGVPSSCE